MTPEIAAPNLAGASRQAVGKGASGGQGRGGPEEGAVFQQLVDTFNEITDFGQSGWFLIPIGAFIVVAAILASGKNVVTPVGWIYPNASTPKPGGVSVTPCGVRTSSLVPSDSSRFLMRVLAAGVEFLILRPIRRASSSCVAPNSSSSC